MDWNNRNELCQQPCSMQLDDITDFDLLVEPVRKNLEFIYIHCQKHLDANVELLNGNCYFYFQYDWRVNAFSYKNKDCRKISIFLGVNNSLDEIFGKLLESNKVGKHVAEFAKTTTLMWIYFHEFAHQIQNRDALEFEYKEMLNNSEENNEIKHLNEFDADMYATMNVSSAVYRNAIELNDAPEVILEKMGALSAFLFWFFNSIGNEPKDLYLYSNSHPHCLIRSLYIIDRIQKVINDNYPGLPSELIYDYFIEYLKFIAEIDASIKIEAIASTIHSEDQNITNYIKSLQLMHDDMVNSAIKLDKNIITK